MGKTVSRLNAATHGVLSGLQVLPRVERQCDWEVHHKLMLANPQARRLLGDLPGRAHRAVLLEIRPGCTLRARGRRHSPGIHG